MSLEQIANDYIVMGNQMLHLDHLAGVFAYRIPPIEEWDYNEWKTFMDPQPGSHPDEWFPRSTTNTETVKRALYKTITQMIRNAGDLECLTSPAPFIREYKKHLIDNR